MQPNPCEPLLEGPDEPEGSKLFSCPLVTLSGGRWHPTAAEDGRGLRGLKNVVQASVGRAGNLEGLVVSNIVPPPLMGVDGYDRYTGVFSQAGPRSTEPTASEVGIYEKV